MRTLPSLSPYLFGEEMNKLSKQRKNVQAWTLPAGLRRALLFLVCVHRSTAKTPSSWLLNGYGSIRRINVLGRSALRGGAQAWSERWRDRTVWDGEMNRLDLLEGVQPSLVEQESEAEALFRQAFFLTHYRLNYLHAQQLYQRVLAMDPNHVQALVSYGYLLYLAFNDYDQSERMLRRAIALDPSNLLARLQLDVVGCLKRVASGVHEAASATPSAGRGSGSPGREARRREWEEEEQGAEAALEAEEHRLRPAAARAAPASAGRAAPEERRPRSYQERLGSGAAAEVEGSVGGAAEEPTFGGQHGGGGAGAGGIGIGGVGRGVPGKQGPGDEGKMGEGEEGEEEDGRVREPEEVGEAPEESPGELEAQLGHKKWSVRAHGYQRLARRMWEMHCEGAGEEAWREAGEQVARGVGDSNVPAQEKALGAARLLLQAGPLEVVGEQAERLAETLVQRGLASPRAGGTARRLLLLLVASGGAEPVMQQLVAGMAARQGKLAGACVGAARAALRAFGGGVVPTEALGKASVGLFESGLAPVRAEAVGLAVELVRWEGAGARGRYGGLRAVQRKELDAALEALPTRPPRPSRRLRPPDPRQPPAERASGGEEEEEGSAAAAAAAEAGGAEVEVLSRLPKDWASKVLKGGKWSERKEEVDKLVALIGSPAPRLEPSGEYGEVLRSLRLLLHDPMVLLVAAALRALASLGEGLGEHFKASGVTLCGAVMEKLKDKNKGVLEAAHSALDAWHAACFLLDDVADSAAAALAPAANPKVKAQVLEWLQRCFRQRSRRLSADGDLPRAAPALCDAVFWSLDDGSAQVREAAYAAGAAMIRACRSSRLLARLEESKLDPKKKKRLLEAAGIAA